MLYHTYKKLNSICFNFFKRDNIYISFCIFSRFHASSTIQQVIKLITINFEEGNMNSELKLRKEFVNIQNG